MAFPEGDFRRAWVEDSEQNAQFREDLETVEQLERVVPVEDTMAAFALRFATSPPAVSCATPGARNRRQAEANVAAGTRPALSAAEKAAVDAIVTPEAGERSGQRSPSPSSQVDPAPLVFSHALGTRQESGCRAVLTENLPTKSRGIQATQMWPRGRETHSDLE